MVEFQLQFWVSERFSSWPHCLSVDTCWYREGHNLTPWKGGGSFVFVTLSDLAACTWLQSVPFPSLYGFRNFKNFSLNNYPHESQQWIEWLSVNCPRSSTDFSKLKVLQTCSWCLRWRELGLVDLNHDCLTSCVEDWTWKGFIQLQTTLTSSLKLPPNKKISSEVHTKNFNRK